MESQREAKPLLKNLLPFSLQGEGDTGGEVDYMDNLRRKLEYKVKKDSIRTAPHGVPLRRDSV